MTCAVCGATSDNKRAHCVICGYAKESTNAETWDRAVEAAAYTDLMPCVEPEESLLGVTRGKIAGSWRRRLSFNPQAFLSPYVNLGITNERLLLQHINAGSGQSLSTNAGTLALSEIVSMSVTDADMLEPGRTMRLVVTPKGEEPFRLRVAGRLAENARDMIAVWETLCGASAAKEAAVESCGSCGRSLDRPYRFCPYCGSALGEK